MFIVSDTLTVNGITQIRFVVGKKDGDLLILRDFMGKKAVLDHRHYAGVFSAVFAAVRQPDRVVTLDFTLDGDGWHLKATPSGKVDLDAAYAAFNEALKHPD